MTKKLLLLLIFVCAAIKSNAQSIEIKDASKNTIHVTAGSILFYSTVNLHYDRLVLSSENGFFKKYYASVEAGLFNILALDGPNSNGFKAGIGIMGLTGIDKHHFEVGLGVSFLTETNIYNLGAFDEENKQNYVFPELNLGYRYQTKKGIMYRIGAGLPEIFYIGIGYSF